MPSSRSRNHVWTSFLMSLVASLCLFTGSSLLWAAGTRSPGARCKRRLPSSRRSTRSRRSRSRATSWKRWTGPQIGSRRGTSPTTDHGCVTIFRGNQEGSPSATCGPGTNTPTLRHQAPAQGMWCGSGVVASTEHVGTEGHRERRSSSDGGNCFRTVTNEDHQEAPFTIIQGALCFRRSSNKPA